MASDQSATPEEGEFLSQQDGRFIIECLRNIDESRTVNLTNVGAAMGYTNTASVGNRFRAIRKRYGFPNLEATTKPSNANTTSAASVLITPPGQGKRKGPSGGRKKSMTKTEEPKDPFITDNSEAETIITIEVPKVKAAPKKGVRKGAKVTSTPISATELGAPRGSKHSKANSESKVKAEIVKDESIDVNLLNAVNDAMEIYEDRKSFEMA